MGDGVLIVGALRFELAGFRRRSELRSCRFGVTGMGRLRARANLAALLRAHRSSVVMGVGLCGGLSGGGEPFELAVPHSVVCDGDEEERKLDVKWTAGGKVCVPPCRTGRMLSVSRVAATPAEKHRLARVYAADWVDQETFGWCEAAQDQSIPFIALRDVLDGPDDTLPAWRAPRTWPAALPLPAAALRARRILTEAGSQIACALL
jgi:nucleoside phosphorylase